MGYLLWRALTFMGVDSDHVFLKLFCINKISTKTHYLVTIDDSFLV